MKTKVLITGANGFIGSHLTAACLAQGMEVHAAMRSTSDLSVFRQIVGDAPHLRSVTLDYQNAGHLAQFIADNGYSYIVHNAGVTKTKEESVYNQTNAEMTRMLARATVDSGVKVKRFIYLSSLAALGPLAYDGSGERPQPLTAYGRSKLLAERYLQSQPGLPVTVIRPTAVYGPGEKDLLIVFRMLAKGLDLNMGSTPQKLTFVHVSDLVSAVLLAMKESPAPWLSFNISDGFEYNRYALSDAMKKATGKGAIRFHVPVAVVKALAWLNEAYADIAGNYPALNQVKVQELTAENWACNIDSAVKALGYRPNYHLNRGVAETILWYQQQQWL
jgi:nucleoside-diphosphate-sugar epimerase